MIMKNQTKMSKKELRKNNEILKALWLNTKEELIQVKHQLNDEAVKHAELELKLEEQRNEMLQFKFKYYDLKLKTFRRKIQEAKEMNQLFVDYARKSNKRLQKQYKKTMDIIHANDEEALHETNSYQSSMPTSPEKHQEEGELTESSPEMDDPNMDSEQMETTSMP
uniref:Uncharacterized protein n=1 Tax=Panagrolaimus sp. JU765 TaxID=591449 RepID=A0AC34Q120_9BILA